MEEEYRLKEAEESIRKGSKVHTMSIEEGLPEEVPLRDQLSPNGTSIPIIKISTESESDREREQEEAEEQARVKAIEEAAAAEKVADESADQSVEDIKLDGLSLSSDHEKDEENQRQYKHGSIKGKPSIAAASDEEDSSGNEDDEVELSFLFSNKRLCARWLDNLFMGLYEDLRRYAIWLAELQHFRSIHAPY
ncbi:hypothetical protein BGZ65_010408, partial [Modicella reniformis]